MIAYPAITLIRRGQSGITCVASDPSIDSVSLSSLANSLGTEASNVDNNIIRIDGLTQGKAPWIVTGCDSSRLLREIEAEIPLPRMLAARSELALPRVPTKCSSHRLKPSMSRTIENYR